MDIKLTEYGKRLLSKGKFKPKFYAFFDDGVLYDSQYGGFAEAQNDAEPRITKDTPQLETQAIYNGVESNVQRQNEIIKFLPPNGEEIINGGVNRRLDQGETFQNTTDRMFSLTYPLGTSQLSTDLLPSWNIKLLRGQMSGSVTLINETSCSNQIVNIVQIPAAPITYQTRIDTLTDEEILETNPSELYGNQTITVLEENSAILLQIEEDNVDFAHENFDIEIYEIKKETDAKVASCSAENQVEELIPLYFTKNVSNVQNNILMDIDERQQIFENPDLELDSSYVEYFFDITVDNEIDKGIICDLIGNETTGVFNQPVLKCDPPVPKKLLSAQDLFDNGGNEDCSE